MAPHLPFNQTTLSHENHPYLAFPYVSPFRRPSPETNFPPILECMKGKCIYCALAT